MTNLSSSGQAAVQDIAQRHGFSVEATKAMVEAVARGNGSMAQFRHSEFGGAGQWMRGGMTMVGDMFNHSLKHRVDALCQDVSRLVASEQVSLDPASTSTSFGDHGNWWPAGLGSPNASGSQNEARYAYFAAARRLAIQQEGRTTLYDTLDHRIGGVSQQQSTGSSLSFSSQHGPVEVSALPVVSGATESARPTAAATSETVQGHGDIFLAIEKLAALRERGILGEGEFEAKKTELLRRV